MVGVQKNRVVKFLPQAPDQRGKLSDADERALCFRSAYQYRYLQLTGSPEDRLQQYQIAHIEMTDRHFIGLRTRQSLTQTNSHAFPITLTDFWAETL
jgi:hypothetical protein